MIDCRRLSVCFDGAAVLSDCSVHIAPGEHAALTGPSGCGKTTLLRCVAGLVSPASGTVTVNGSVSAAFQEPRLFPWLSAEQNLALVAGRENALLWLRRSGLGDAAKKYPSELSGGMRQRLNLCRAMAFPSDVLLLDEPFQGLDSALRQEMAALLAEHSRERTLLLVSHDPEDLVLADTVYRFSSGTFVRV